MTVTYFKLFSVSQLPPTETYSLKNEMGVSEWDEQHSSDIRH